MGRLGSLGGGEVDAESEWQVKGAYDGRKYQGRGSKKA
jgi:hypothetical protein